jgi:hypothetical protein
MILKEHVQIQRQHCSIAGLQTVGRAEEKNHKPLPNRSRGIVEDTLQCFTDNQQHYVGAVVGIDTVKQSIFTSYLRTHKDASFRDKMHLHCNNNKFYPLNSKYHIIYH